MQIWGCFRMTVNKAVAALAAEGIVEPNRRAGTFVARPLMHAAVLRIPDLRAEVAAHGSSYVYRVLADELRPPCCEHLGTEGHHLGPSRFLRSVHTVDGRALLLEDRHIFLDSVPEAEKMDYSEEPPGPWLLSHVLWADAEHRISAIVADAVMIQWQQGVHPERDDDRFLLFAENL